MSKERFDIEETIRILGLEMRAEQADGGKDFDVACRIVLNELKKCKEYEKLEEQGLLLRLPCKVGDTVYTVCSWGIESGVVGSIEIISDRVFVNNIHGAMIGEAQNIFLTQSEAEEKLRELEKNR